MNWDLYGRFRSETSVNNPEGGGDELGLWLRKCLEEDKLLHPRRTLDQYYYSSLKDTTVRDSDQTISKWTGSGCIDLGGRAAAGADSLLIMIDQLWCWVLDDSESSVDCDVRSFMSLLVF
jgi:hypothetical protein